MIALGPKTTPSASVRATTLHLIQSACHSHIFFEEANTVAQQHIRDYLQQWLINDVFIELDQLIDIVEGYRQRRYNEDMMCVEKLGGKYSMARLTVIK